VSAPQAQPLFEIDEIPRPIRAALEPITSIAFPAQGMTSQVALIESAGVRWVVKRADRPPFHDWLTQEYRVLQALGTTGLPAPVVLVLVTRAGGVGPDHWLLMSYLPGETLEARLQANPPPEIRRHLLMSFGALLGRIHRLPAPAVLARDEPWVELRLKEAAYNVAHYPVDGSHELLEQLRQTRPRPVAPTVIHGDFTLDNVLVTDDEVTGVIDWSQGAIGDPRHDLSVCTQQKAGAFQYPDDLEAFYAGYGGTRLEADEREYFLGLDEFF
jgi:aminoglycoside phosphotransferase (APT) family kinase protein